MGCKGAHCNNYYTPCILVRNPCGGFDGSYNNYSCSGHTGKRLDNKGSFNEYVDGSGEARPYQIGDTVSHPDINQLRNEVVKEMNARKVHPLYAALRTSPAIPEVKRGDIVDHEQQNSIASAIKLMA